jgi:hypothetical protein
VPHSFQLKTIETLSFGERLKRGLRGRRSPLWKKNYSVLRFALLAGANSEILAYIKREYTEIPDTYAILCPTIK